MKPVDLAGRTGASDPLLPLMLWLSGPSRNRMPGHDLTFPYYPDAALAFPSVGNAGEPQPIE